MKTLLYSLLTGIMQHPVTNSNSEKQSIVETHAAHTKINLFVFSQTQAISKLMFRVSFSNFGKVIFYVIYFPLDMPILLNLMKLQLSFMLSRDMNQIEIRPTV
jgi:hypothetical protein